MRTVLTLATSAALFAMSVPAQAQGLVLVLSNAAGRELLVDPFSLKTLGPQSDLRRFPAVELYVEMRSPGGRRTGAVTERVRYHFNCTAGTVNTISYYRGFANGTRSHDWRGADWADRYEPVKPGTLTEQAMAYACSGGKLPVAPTPEAPETTPKDDPDGE